MRGIGRPMDDSLDLGQQIWWATIEPVVKPIDNGLNFDATPPSVRVGPDFSDELGSMNWVRVVNAD
tara:strand:+ start:436 stop:633 length:198 start_codon:yes stop_codon:yes gene_type:complete